MSGIRTRRVCPTFSGGPTRWSRPSRHGSSTSRHGARAVADIGERLDLLIERPHPHDANRRLVKHLRHERQALFTFLTTDGVDATNWRAEQGVRPAVVNQKVWGGNRTDRGAEAQGRLMTFLRTAHQQGVDAIALLVDWPGRPTPSPESAVGSLRSHRRRGAAVPLHT